MDKKSKQYRKLEKKVASLEFVNEQLKSELNYIQEMLITVGFPEGITTLKQAAEDLIKIIEEMDDNFD